MGTPFYMAPEQLQGDGEVDQRADIYSLGVLAYQMLTGHLPHGDFAPASQSVPAMGNQIDDAIMRAMAQDPRLRFQDVREMIEALDLVRRGHGRQDKKRVVLVAGLVCLLVIGLLFTTGGITNSALIRKEQDTDRKEPKVIGSVANETWQDIYRIERAGLDEIKHSSTGQPGILRAEGVRANGRSFDLSRATGINDFTEVVARSDFWLALRSNGELRSSNPQWKEKVLYLFRSQVPPTLVW